MLCDSLAAQCHLLAGLMQGCVFCLASARAGKDSWHPGTSAQAALQCTWISCFQANILADKEVGVMSIAPFDVQIIQTPITYLSFYLGK